MVKVLEDNTYVDLVYADDLITVVENETYNSATVKTNKDRPEFDLAKLFVNCYIGPHPMWRSSLHDRYGFFNEKYRVAGDYDFWLRLALCCNFKHISEYLGLYLVSTTSAERRRLRVTYAETEEIINKHLQYVVFSRAQMAPIMKKQSQRTYKLGKQYYREALFMAALQALTRSLKYNWKNMDAYKWLCRVFFAGLLLRHRKQRPFGD